jgi:hypothetical protein
MAHGLLALPVIVEQFLDLCPIYIENIPKANNMHALLIYEA